MDRCTPGGLDLDPRKLAIVQFRAKGIDCSPTPCAPDRAARLAHWPAPQENEDKRPVDLSWTLWAELSVDVHIMTWGREQMKNP